MKTRALIRNGLALSLLLFSLPLAADYPLEIIQLKFRPLQDILPVIRPLIGEDGSATGMNNTLVLKAAPGQIADIKKLLQEIDRPPRRLMITVSKQGSLERSRSGYSASADIRVGDGQISVNSPRRHVDRSRVRVRVYDTDDQRSRSSDYRVQALEGRPALIESGTRVPIHTVERYYRHGHPYVRRLTHLEQASSGFYVIPHLSGEYVTLDIQQRDDRPGMGYGVIDTQSTDTVVRGRLGEWIPLGGIDTSRRHHEGGLGRSITTQDAVNEAIEVRVDCLDCAATGGP